MAVFNLDLERIADRGLIPSGYRPFSYVADDRGVANVSVLPVPMRIHGRDVAAGGILSVATDPGWRGRGLFTELMVRALAFCDASFELVWLYTAQPMLYERHGFKPVEQHLFRLSVPRAGAPAARSLSLARGDDRALVDRLIREREPVSGVFAVRHHGEMLLLNVLARGYRVLHLPEPDVVLVWDEIDGRTRLLDIVGRSMPDAGTVAAALGCDSDALEVLFHPDRLAARAEPVRFAEGDTLMVRGPFTVRQPIMLPPTAVF